MDWVPIVFGIFKLGVLGICMFFAIKWHFDKDKEAAQKKKEEALMNSVASGQDENPMPEGIVRHS